MTSPPPPSLEMASAVLPSIVESVSVASKWLRTPPPPRLEKFASLSRISQLSTVSVSKFWMPPPPSVNLAELAAIRTCVKRGSPYGRDQWQRRTVQRLGLESTVRRRGRPNEVVQSERQPELTGRSRCW